MDKKLNELIAASERLNLGEYVRFQEDRKRRLIDAFLQGVMRGIGAMVGFAVLGALVIWLLQGIANKSLPWISEFVAEIVKLVQLRMNHS